MSSKAKEIDTVASTHDSLVHLSEKAKQQLALTDAERIVLIRKGGWIQLAHASNILAELEDLLVLDNQTRPRSLLLIGESNSGKTSILERFAGLHPAGGDRDSETATASVISIDCPDSPDRDALCMTLLDAMFVPYKPTTKYAAKFLQLAGVLKKLQTKVILIDEMHHAIAGSLTQQTHFLNAIKRLSNMTKAHIVAAGLEKARTLFVLDEQLTSRFKPIRLPQWKAGTEMGELLNTLENRLPLRHPSILKAADKMLAISKRAEGSLGDTIDLVRECAVATIKLYRSKKIREEAISLALIKSVKWTPPSARRKFATSGDS